MKIRELQDEMKSYKEIRSKSPLSIFETLKVLIKDKKKKKEKYKKRNEKGST